jgi:hypothetical protein
MKYIVMGIERSARRKGMVINLQRVDDASYTWAPASDAEKFILVYDDERQADVDGEYISEKDAVDHLARRNSLEVLTAAVERREEIDAEVMVAHEAKEADEAIRRARRDVAIKALEKAAREGDVGAANSLLELTS